MEGFCAALREGRGEGREVAEEGGRGGVGRGREGGKAS